MTKISAVWLVAVVLAAGCGGSGAVAPTDPAFSAGTSAAPASATTTPRTSTDPSASFSVGTAPLGSPAFGTSPTGLTETATVLRVVDGDTIEVDRGFGPEKVRYIGVDTPETVEPGSPIDWMGPEASAANSALVAGREVVLERDVSETDRFGRLLRYVWIPDAAVPSGWLFVNLELVARGFAQVSTYPPDVKYVDLYLVAQAGAREAGLGLWGPAASLGPSASTAAASDCDPSYPNVCIPPPPPDLDCGDITFRRFAVVGADPHRLDGDGDGIGCEG